MTIECCLSTVAACLPTVSTLFSKKQDSSISMVRRLRSYFSLNSRSRSRLVSDENSKHSKDSAEVHIDDGAARQQWHELHLKNDTVITSHEREPSNGDDGIYVQKSFANTSR